MRYIFETASNEPEPEPEPEPSHPYYQTIYLPKSKTGWSDGNQTFKTPEKWLKYTSHKLLLLGITDVLCMAVTPNKEKKEAYKFTFYFTNAAHCFQFQAATLTDKKGDFNRRIEAPTPEKSEHQRKKLVSFLEEHEMEHALLRINARTLLLTTSSSQNDLIIAMQMANKTFDSPHNISSDHRKIPSLLRLNEKTEPS